MPRNRRRDDDDDDDDYDRPRPRKPRRKRKTDPTPWIIGGVLLGIGVLVAVVVIASSRGNRDGAKGDSGGGGGGGGGLLGGGSGGDGPMVEGPGGKMFPEKMLIDDALTMGASEFNPPAAWTHQDLANLLGRKGIPVTVLAGPGGKHGQGAVFQDARPGGKRGSVPVYRCASKRDAARQVVSMRPHLYLPYVVGHFAVGFDGSFDPPDADIFFASDVKGVLMFNFK